ncbi:MAG: hypothetical protein PHQ40_21620 [Anaerolineaceae bacterium]|nr:hypothetical protein [Anaerolineaceae bacterium]
MSKATSDHEDAPKQNMYQRIIEVIFFNHYREGVTEFFFNRTELVDAANSLQINLPKNIGDTIYALRYRIPLPPTILSTSPVGSGWVIWPAGRGKYKFTLGLTSNFIPNPAMVETKIPDATPGIIARYALNDEQALLAKIRYNRLVDIFMGLTCYSLQNHLRTAVTGFGQVETDEIYIGLDKRGAHFVIPVQAKGGKDKIGVIQIEQDLALCKEKYPNLICRPVAAQFMRDNLISLFEFELNDGRIGISTEKHYRLVQQDDLSPEEIELYSFRPE